jgi:glycosyltransferase involved in cell wall biosynthesis
MWPEIRKEVPGATLHIYYGFETFDVMYKDNPGKMAWKNDVMNMMKQPGITYHGRVGHNVLHEEMSKSGVWAYPTDFTEISCITAMKVQALGAIPVCTPVAALEETVKNGIKIDVDTATEDGQREFVKQLVKMLKNEKLQKEIRPSMMTWARKNFGWDLVARNWDALMRLKTEITQYAFSNRDKTKLKISKKKNAK